MEFEQKKNIDQSLNFQRNRSHDVRNLLDFIILQSKIELHNYFMKNLSKCWGTYSRPPPVSRPTLAPIFSMFPQLLRQKTGLEENFE